VVADMSDLGIWEPYQVKAQTIKTAIEVGVFSLLLELIPLQAACLLLRVDDIVSGMAGKKKE